MPIIALGYKSVLSLIFKENPIGLLFLVKRILYPIPIPVPSSLGLALAGIDLWSSLCLISLASATQHE